MYDYVLQYGFDDNTRDYIQSIKDYLKENGIEDKERNWLPHITIDLYNCKGEKEFIEKCDNAILGLKSFKVEFRKLNHCNNETLYIEPHNDEQLLKLKLHFDNELDDYMIEKRRTRNYIPHITLCTTPTLDKAIHLSNKKFKPFTAEIKYIWIYNSNMELIKTYDLI